MVNFNVFSKLRCRAVPIACVSLLFFTSRLYCLPSTIEKTTHDTFNPSKQLTELIEKSNNASSSDLHLALDYAQEALFLSNKSQDLSLSYAANNQVAKIFFYIGIFDKAVDFWLNCDSIALQLNDYYL